MTDWPKNPDVRAPTDGSDLLPVGPLNLFNEKLAHAQAINHAHVVKATYDQEHPNPQPALPRPAPRLAGPLTDPGSPVLVDESEYMIDVSVSAGYRRR